MKIILIKLDLQCSTVTYQSGLIPISDFFLSSEVVTMWQTNSTAYKAEAKVISQVHTSLSLFCRLLPQYELHLTKIEKQKQNKIKMKREVENKIK